MSEVLKRLYMFGLVVFTVVMIVQIVVGYVAAEVGIIRRV